MMSNWGYGGYGMMSGFGWIGSILFLILLVLAIAWLWKNLDVSQGFHNSKIDHSSSKALDIARERFAKGEINKDEFEHIKQALM